MNEQAVLERIEYLKLQQRQMQANLYGIDGALQDCEFWLSRIKEEAEKAANGKAHDDAPQGPKEVPVRLAGEGRKGG